MGFKYTRRPWIEWVDAIKTFSSRVHTYTKLKNLSTLDREWHISIVAKAFSGRPTKIQDEILHWGLRGTPGPNPSNEHSQKWCFITHNLLKCLFDLRKMWRREDDTSIQTYAHFEFSNDIHYISISLTNAFHICKTCHISFDTVTITNLRPMVTSW